MKKLIRKIFEIAGCEIIRQKTIPDPATPDRPIGNVITFLEDIRKRGLNPGSVFDIGANNAEWSRKIKEVFPEANFVLIEPQIEMKAALESFCMEFPGSSYFLVGAGSAHEQKVLTVWEDFAGSSLLPAAREELLLSGKQRKIEIATVDELIRENNLQIPEIIKLDIQGYELEALRGADKTFGITELYILEVSMFPFSDTPGTPVFHEVVDFMLKRGYVVYDFAGFMRRPVDGALGQCDVCFVKSNGIFRKLNSWN